jgi:hypothetical protein
MIIPIFFHIAHYSRVADKKKFLSDIGSINIVNRKEYFYETTILTCSIKLQQIDNQIWMLPGFKICVSNSN